MGGNVRSFSVSRKYSRVRELYMECDFDLLMLNAVICAILFDWLSDIYELITEKVSKKFRGMLAGSAKVCTFAKFQKSFEECLPVPQKSVPLHPLSRGKRVKEMKF